MRDARRRHSVGGVARLATRIISQGWTMTDEQDVTGPPRRRVR
jgi:hypothetical protein